MGPSVGRITVARRVERRTQRASAR
jgi:hypothetical protein